MQNVELNQGIIVWETILHNFINMELKINYNNYAIVITDSSLTIILKKLQKDFFFRECYIIVW